MTDTSTNHMPQVGQTRRDHLGATFDVIDESPNGTDVLCLYSDGKSIVIGKEAIDRLSHYLSGPTMHDPRIAKSTKINSVIAELDVNGTTLDRDVVRAVLRARDGDTRAQMSGVISAIAHYATSVAGKAAHAAETSPVIQSSGAYFNSRKIPCDNLTVVNNGAGKGYTITIIGEMSRDETSRFMNILIAEAVGDLNLITTDLVPFKATLVSVDRDMTKGNTSTIHTTLTFVSKPAKAADAPTEEAPSPEDVKALDAALKYLAERGATTHQLGLVELMWTPYRVGYYDKDNGPESAPTGKRKYSIFLSAAVGREKIGLDGLIEKAADLAAAKGTLSSMASTTAAHDPPRTRNQLAQDFIERFGTEHAKDGGALVRQAFSYADEFLRRSSRPDPTPTT